MTVASQKANHFNVVYLCSSDKCKFMDSKMKPLWMVWGSQDPMGQDVLLLYKKGDGESYLLSTTSGPKLIYIRFKTSYQ